MTARTFGTYIRSRRMALQSETHGYSLRKVAGDAEIEPSYLSKIERDQVPPPSESSIRRIAVALDEDADVLLAMAGKISDDIQKAILKHPELFSELIRLLKDAPEKDLNGMVREARAKYGNQ